MSRLKAIKPQAAEPTKPKILVFGPPGVGKTWGALDFPSCYYIDTEGGANFQSYKAKLEASGGVYLGPEQESCSFDTILDQVKALATEQHRFRTLVIDSISKVYHTEIALEAERMAAANVKNEFAADKKPATRQMRILVSWLSRLDMNVLLIAYQKDEWGQVNGKREAVDKTFDCWDRLAYELHLSLQIVPTTPNNPRARVRKTRLEGFPSGDTFAWSYEEFATRYGKDVIEREAIALTLASDDQIAEIERLLAKVKVPDGWQDKILTAANATTWQEMDADKASKTVAYLKNLLTE